MVKDFKCYSSWLLTQSAVSRATVTGPLKRKLLPIPASWDWNLHLSWCSTGYMSSDFMRVAQILIFSTPNISELKLLFNQFILFNLSTNVSHNQSALWISALPIPIWSKLWWPWTGALLPGITVEISSLLSMSWLFLLELSKLTNALIAFPWEVNIKYKSVKHAIAWTNMSGALPWLQ